MPTFFPSAPAPTPGESMDKIKPLNVTGALPPICTGICPIIENIERMQTE